MGKREEGESHMLSHTKKKEARWTVANAERAILVSQEEKDRCETRTSVQISYDEAVSIQDQRRLVD